MAAPSNADAAAAWSGRLAEPLLLLGISMLAIVWSGIAPRDRFTWMLEIAPVVIGVPILVALYPRFPFTRLAYRLIFVHALLLIVGAHYTYAEVPLGAWVKSLFGFARNHYDRLGHFAQGFVPAILAREVLMRRMPSIGGAWLVALVTAVCLAISALYELFEGASALLTGTAADAFLGTQGDPWDTQWDMFTALVGALVAQLTLARTHDREIAGLRVPAR